MIREITEQDYQGLMRHSMKLHDNPFPEQTERLWQCIWKTAIS